MDLQIDFAAFLPQMYLPTYDKVISLLTQTVPDFPRGGAMLTRAGKGVFSIKDFDKTKAEKMLGKRIEYYYEEGKSTKKGDYKHPGEIMAREIHKCAIHNNDWIQQIPAEPTRQQRH